MYQTIHIKKGEITQVDYHLMTWDPEKGNLADFDLTEYDYIGFYLYADEVEEPLIEFASCDIDDVTTGWVHYDIDATDIDGGAYRVMFEAVKYATGEFASYIKRFPEQSFQHLWVLDDAQFW